VIERIRLRYLKQTEKEDPTLTLRDSIIIADFEEIENLMKLKVQLKPNLLQNSLDYIQPLILYGV
jgi:hypothetical protein